MREHAYGAAEPWPLHLQPSLTYPSPVRLFAGQVQLHIAFKDARRTAARTVPCCARPAVALGNSLRRRHWAGADDPVPAPGERAPTLSSQLHAASYAPGCLFLTRMMSWREGGTGGAGTCTGGQGGGRGRRALGSGGGEGAARGGGRADAHAWGGAGRAGGALAGRVATQRRFVWKWRELRVDSAGMEALLQAS